MNSSESNTSQSPLLETRPVDNRQHKKVRIIIAAFIVLLIFGLFVFFFKSPRRQTKAITPASTLTQAESHEITRETVIASSLAVPPLYPRAQWKEVSKASADSYVETLIFNGKNFSLTGTYWETQIPNDTASGVATYYFDELAASKWFGKDGTSTLHFADGTITPPAAGGPCGGIEGFLGYKDGLIRLITVSSKVAPCNPLAGNPHSTTNYKVFVSDTTSLQGVMENFKSGKKN